METINNNNNTTGHTVGYQQPHPNSSILARQQGYVCSCDNGAWCDGACYWKQPNSTPARSQVAKTEPVPKTARPQATTDTLVELDATYVKIIELAKKNEELEKTLARQAIELRDQLNSIDRLMAENARLQEQLKESDAKVAEMTAREGSITPVQSSAVVQCQQAPAYNTSTYPNSLEVLQTPTRKNVPHSGMILNAQAGSTVNLYVTQSGPVTPQNVPSGFSYWNQPQPQLVKVEYPRTMVERRNLLYNIGYTASEAEYYSSDQTPFYSFSQALMARGYTC